MTHVVLKPFNSNQSRFTPGDKISAATPLEPHTLGSLTAAGLVELDKPAPAKNSGQQASQ